MIRRETPHQAYVDRLMAANALVVQISRTWSFGPPAMIERLVRRSASPGDRAGSFPIQPSKTLWVIHALPASRPMVARAGRPIAMADPPRKIVNR